ncbi:hypothetical protein [Noviherbaspirillum aerium]|uniref:hypothetical protein n=1 Tax=Noviherbaspirillum aerium TaxID=2588497 RepID=UPI00124CF5D9|nr:hypothetical protein [Noviherbaspirillum aerium]
MLTLRRLADLVVMALVAIPLFGCGDAVTRDARSGSQSRPASDAMSQKPAPDADEARDMTAADEAMMNRISRIEGRHFDLYRHYRMLAARQMHGTADGVDDEVDDDGADGAEGALRHAVISFSASSLSHALSGCSMRALMTLD